MCDYKNGGEIELLKTILKRVLQCIPTLFIVVTFTFVLTRMIPGNPAATILGPQASAADIQAIFCNGGTAYRFYRRYDEAVWGKAEALPSTSPANARSSVQALTERWRAALAPWL